MAKYKRKSNGDKITTLADCARWLDKEITFTDEVDCSQWLGYELAVRHYATLLMWSVELYSLS